MNNKQIWEKVKSALDAQALEIDQSSWDLFVSELDRHYDGPQAGATLNLYTDGAARGNPGPAGIGIVLQDDSGKTVKEHFEYIGEQTNNVAEYMALIRGLALAAELGGKEVHVFSDSELMTKQINGEYKVKNRALIDLYAQASKSIRNFENVRITHVKRNMNSGADRLANMAIDARK